MDCGHGLAANRRSLLIPLTVAVLVGLPSVALADGPSLEFARIQIDAQSGEVCGTAASDRQTALE